MQKTKRLFTALLAGLLAVGSFSACSSEPSTSSKAADAGGESSAAQAESMAEKAPADYTGTVNVWTWEPYENQKAIIDDFNKTYSGVTVEFTTVNSADMPMKIQTALASDSDIPDVVWCEISNRGKMMSLDCWEDLSAAPYNVDRADMLDYQIPVSETPSGKLAGIEVSTPVAGLAYKRDLAKQYLGTDDPDELAKLIPTWEAMIEKGKEIKEKSGGKVKLFSAPGTPFNIIKGQNQKPYIIDNKLNLKESLGGAFDITLEMMKADIVDNIEAGTPAEDASIAGSEHIFVGCPTWAPTWVIKAKDPKGSGNWGMMLPPGGGYMNGGTVTAIPQKAEDKEAAFQYIRWNYFSKEGGISNRDNLDYMIPYKPVYEDENFYSRADEFFAGQDVLKTFAQVIIPNTKVPRQVHKYDMEVNNATNIALKTLAGGADGLTTDQLLADMAKEIINNVPELTAE